MGKHSEFVVSLCVVWLLAMVLAPPNASARLGDYDYCDPILCGEGEGDCDGNFDCQPGLVCVNDQGAYYPNFPPPSVNYDPSIVDVCEAPNPDLCRDFGPCPAGNGDCDSNSECQAGLTCVADVGAKYGYPANYDVCEARGGPAPDPNYCVYNYCGIGDGDCDPGQCNEGVCVNDVGARYGLPAHYDVCEASSGGRGYNGHVDFCRDYGPCGVGQGDCDGNRECQAGLTCVQDVGASYGFPSDYDVCEASSTSSQLWNAIALGSCQRNNQNHVVWGLAQGHTEQEASRAADQACENKGPCLCQVYDTWNTRQCIGIAFGRGSGGAVSVSYAGGVTATEAGNAAVASCRRNYPTHTCSLDRTFCP